MVDPYLRQSPLAHLHLDARVASDGGLTDAAVILAELPHRGQLLLRGDTGNPTFRNAVEKAIKTGLPTTAGTVSGSSKGTHIIWQGPDEWLVVTKPGAEEKTKKALFLAIANQHAAVTDLSESRTVIRITGDNAREVLMKGCSIDLHPRVFGPGHCAETLLAQAHVILHQTVAHKTSGIPTYEIYVYRSFAEYLWTWLEDAGREFGVKVATA